MAKDQYKTVKIKKRLKIVNKRYISLYIILYYIILQSGPITIKGEPSFFKKYWKVLPFRLLGSIEE